MHDDPGLQPERTILAWNRTTVSLAVCSAILLRWTNHYGAWSLVPVVGLIVMAMFILFTQRIRYVRQSSGLARESLVANVSGVVSLTILLILFGAAGIAFVLMD